MAKKRKNDNPLPVGVYEYMTRFLPPNSAREKFDLHHSLVDKGDVRGMDLVERGKIHHPYNLWWVKSSDHASHANIGGKRSFYKLLCQRWGKEVIDEFVRSFNWKSTPPVTVEWLESED